MTTEDSLKKLIPVITTQAQQEMIAYQIVSEKYSKEISEIAMEDLKVHPIFGRLISDIPKEILEARSQLSAQLQKDAILNNNWLPYIQYQIEQGIGYAKMGFDFKSWFELVTLVRDYIIPFLQKEYAYGKELISAINGMNRVMDIGMTIIGEAYLREKHGIIQADQETIQKLNEELERKVTNRTNELETANGELEAVNIELEAVNRELEAFTFSVSHDLRAPLRAINGYAQILAEDHAEKLDEDANNVINVIIRNTKKMGVLIDDLLTFSRLGRKELVKGELDMSALVKAVVEELYNPNRDKVIFNLHPLPPALGDYTLLKQVWINLIANGMKFSSTKPEPRIEIGSIPNENEITYYVKDNGVGFDMQYYNKLFGVFQRLHAQYEFEGTGIGLAIVQRVVNAHRGKVWAEAKLNEGASFYFSLPIMK